MEAVLKVEVVLEAHHHDHCCHDRPIVPHCPALRSVRPSSLDHPTVPEAVQLIFDVTVEEEVEEEV